MEVMQKKKKKKKFIYQAKKISPSKSHKSLFIKKNNGNINYKIAEEGSIYN